jgi:hypothetical protein
MTAFSKVCKGEVSDQANKKDGNGSLARQRDYNVILEALDFIRIGWNKWSFTWGGDFPIFTLAPGTFTDDTGTHAGLIARYSLADIEILFPYGTSPADIKTRLNDEILEIMRLQTDAADPLPISPIPFMGEPLPYQPIVVEDQEIGPEIGF